VPALALAALLAFTTQAFADDAPRVDAIRAAKIATDYLRTLGANPPYITSLTLERGGIVSGGSYWVARWSRPVKVDNDREIGLRVNPDGSIARLVDGQKLSRNRVLRFGGMYNQ
jgi:hypothetical protein